MPTALRLPMLLLALLGAAAPTLAAENGVSVELNKLESNGAAGSLGLRALQERCRAMEHHCQAGELAEAAALQADLDALLRDSEAALTAYTEQATAAETTS